MYHRVEIIKREKMNPSVLNQIDDLTKAELGNVAIVKKYKWAEPDWTIAILTDKNQVLSFLNIVERQGLFGDLPVKLAGINNVITPAPWRKKGLATSTLKEAQVFMFNRLKADYGLLLCPNAMIPFYQGLGWVAADCPLSFEQSGQKVTWEQKQVVFPKPKSSFKAPSAINLCGQPW